jgi:hypothetical protein
MSTHPIYKFCYIFYSKPHNKEIEARYCTDINTASFFAIVEETPLGQISVYIELYIDEHINGQCVVYYRTS